MPAAAAGPKLLGATFRCGLRSAKSRTVPVTLSEASELGRVALDLPGLFPADRPPPRLLGVYPPSPSSTSSPAAQPPPVELATDLELEHYLRKVGLCALYAEFWLRPSSSSSSSAATTAPPKEAASAPPLQPTRPPSTPPPPASFSVVANRPLEGGLAPAVLQVRLPADPGVALAAEPGNQLRTEETVQVVEITEDGKRALRRALRHTWSSDVLRTPPPPR